MTRFFFRSARVFCRRMLRLVSAGAVLTVLSGCFLFVWPEKSHALIPDSRARGRHHYGLRENDSYSCMRIYLPAVPADKKCPAVVIFPGGAYGILAWNKEGRDYAEFLNRHGIAGIVVKYPLGSLFGRFKRHPAMLNAAQRAIRLIRYHAPELGIDPQRIGVMGSSAGGHLAGLTAVWESAGNPDSPDPADRVSARPDFAILCYPVVSLSADCAHRLSRANLTGSGPDPVLLNALSLEKRITPECPPVFLWFTLEDRVVNPENGRLLAAALDKNNVPYRAFFYRNGPHGLGLLTAKEKEKYPETAKWPRQLLAFLRDRNIPVSNAEYGHE